jgi:hypothetical protein
MVIERVWRDETTDHFVVDVHPVAQPGLHFHVYVTSDLSHVGDDLKRSYWDYELAIMLP